MRVVRHDEGGLHHLHKTAHAAERMSGRASTAHVRVMHRYTESRKAPSHFVLEVYGRSGEQGERGVIDHNVCAGSLEHRILLHLYAILKLEAVPAHS